MGMKMNKETPLNRWHSSVNHMWSAIHCL